MENFLDHFSHLRTKYFGCTGSHFQLIKKENKTQSLEKRNFQKWNAALSTWIFFLTSISLHSLSLRIDVFQGRGISQGDFGVFGKPKKDNFIQEHTACRVVTAGGMIVPTELM